MDEVQKCGQCGRSCWWREATCIHCHASLAVNVLLAQAPADPKVRYELIKQLSALNLPLNVELPAQLKRETPELAKDVTRAVAAEVGKVLRSLDLGFQIVAFNASVPAPKGARVGWAAIFWAGIALIVVASAVIALERKDPSPPSPVAKAPWVAPPVTPPIGPLTDELRAVVIVNCAGEGFGTGFYVAPRLIVTNHHLLCSRGETTVVLSKGHEVPATVIGSDPKLDLALLSVQVDGKPLPLGDASSARVGDTVSMVGNPYGEDTHATRTTVRFIGRVTSETSVLQLDGPVSQGNSGAPLFDASGRVIGVVIARALYADFLGLAVPINYLVAGARPLWAEGPRDLLTPGWTELAGRVNSRSEIAPTRTPLVEAVPKTSSPSATLVMAGGWMINPQDSVWRKETPVMRVSVFTDDPVDTDRRWAFDLKFGDEVICQMFRTRTESWVKLTDRYVDVPSEFRAVLAKTPGTHYLGAMQLQWSNCPGAFAHRSLTLELPGAQKPFHSLRVSY